MSDSVKHGSPNYAWVVVGVSFFLGVGAIIGSQSWGFIVPYVAKEFGVAVADITIGKSAYGLFVTGLAFLAGMLGQKFGTRVVCTIGACGMGISLILGGLLTGEATGPMGIIIAYGAAGIFASACGGCLVPYILMNWLMPKYRGKGILFNTLGGQAGSMFLSILIPQILIAATWHEAVEVMGALLVVGGIIWFAFSRNTPADIGTVPFGAPADYVPVSALEDKEAAAEKKAAKRAGYGVVLKMPVTYCFGIMNIFWGIYFVGNSAFRPTAILASGLDITVAGSVQFAEACATITLQIVMSTLSDHFSRKKLFGILILGAMLGAILMYVNLTSANPSVAVLILCGALNGCMSGTAPLKNNIMGDIFPPSVRGSGAGVGQTISVLGTFFGPMICAWIVQVTGSPFNIYIFGTVILAIAAALIFFTFPNTGGKYGDPMAEKERAELEAKLAEQGIAA